MKSRLMALAASMIVAACGSGADEVLGGGDKSYCTESFKNGVSEWGCVECGGVRSQVEHFARAIDNDSDTSSGFYLAENGGEITITAHAPEGRTFAGGSDAGALMRLPADTFGTLTVSFSTSRNGVPVDQDVAPDLNIDGTDPNAGEDNYYSFVPVAEFDALQVRISVTGNDAPADFRVTEICGNK